MIDYGELNEVVSKFFADNKDEVCIDEMSSLMDQSFYIRGHRNTLTFEAYKNAVNRIKEIHDHIGRYTICCPQFFAKNFKEEFPNIEVVAFPKNSGVDDKVFLIRHRDKAGEFI